MRYPQLAAGRDERGLTIVELCIVILVVAILLATGVAALLRARMAGNESSAIGSLRTINSAQFAYAAACGSGNYATSLPILAAVPPGNTQGYLSEDLGSSPTPTRSGYTFQMLPGAGSAAAPPDCNNTQTQTKYYARGVPSVLGQTGDRSFATNQAGRIYQAFGAVPPDEPFDPPDQLAQ
jgi:type II secretory pathway pseudopilin PulG